MSAMFPALSFAVYLFSSSFRHTSTARYWFFKAFFLMELRRFLTGVNTLISNCIIDGNLFKGNFAQQISDAGFTIDALESILEYNEAPIDDPYLRIPHTQLVITSFYNNISKQRL